jgi:hypothetical protein
MRLGVINCLLIVVLVSCQSKSDIEYLEINACTGIAAKNSKIFYCQKDSLKCFDIGLKQLVWSAKIDFTPKENGSVFHSVNPILISEKIFLVDDKNNLHVYDTLGKKIKSLNVFNISDTNKVVYLYNIKNTLLFNIEHGVNIISASINDDLSINWNKQIDIHSSYTFFIDNYLISEYFKNYNDENSELVSIDLNTGRSSKLLGKNVIGRIDDFTVSQQKELLIVDDFYGLEFYNIGDSNYIWRKNLKQMIFSVLIIQDKVFAHSSDLSGFIVLDKYTGKEIAFFDAFGTPTYFLEYHNKIIFSYLGDRRINIFNSRDLITEKIYDLDLEYQFFDLLIEEDKLIVFNEKWPSDKIAIITLE